MSLLDIAVLALIAICAGAFCATVKWLRSPLPLGTPARPLHASKPLSATQVESKAE